MKMGYIILYVKDHVESTLFYRDKLGLGVRGEHGTYIEFQTGSIILAINTLKSVRQITGLPLKATHPNQTFELAFVVNDVIEEIERLRKLDVPILVEPVEKPWGQIVAYVADPDGHLIEICSSLD